MFDTEFIKVVSAMGVGAFGMAVTLVLTFRHLDAADKRKSAESKESQERMAGFIANYDRMCDNYNKICQETNNHMSTLFTENMNIINLNTRALTKLSTIIDERLK